MRCKPMFFANLVATMALALGACGGGGGSTADTGGADTASSVGTGATGGNGAADGTGTTGGTGSLGGSGDAKLYIGYYQEDATNNPEDPTLGALMFSVPGSSGAFAGQMPFSYAGCTAGVDLGVIRGSRSGASLAGTWSGSLDGTSVGGAFSGGYDAAADSFSGSYTNSAGKLRVAVGACAYFVAAGGSFKVYGSAASDPAGFTLAATATTTPTLSWTSRGAGVLYTARVFDHACLVADASNAACFLGEATTAGMSAAFPATFPGASALTVGSRYLAVVTAQSGSTFAGFASALFTPATAAGVGSGSTGTGGDLLTVSTTAGDVDFDATRPASSVPSGPLCNPLGTCSAHVSLVWSQVGGGTSRSLGVMLYSRTSSPPGAAPGIDVTDVQLTYSDGATTYVLGCGPWLGAAVCTNTAGSTVRWDGAARTLTLTGAVLPATAGAASGSVTMNGTLRY